MSLKVTKAGFSLFVLMLCCRMFCYACMFDLVALDLVFICSGLVCFLCVSLDHFGFVFSDFIFGGFSCLPIREIGWEGKKR